MSRSIDMKHVQRAAGLIREKIDQAAQQSRDPKTVDAGELREVIWGVERERKDGGLRNLEVALREVETERGMAGVDRSRGAYEQAIGRMLGRVASGAKRDGQPKSVSWEEAGRMDDRARWLVLLADELALKNGR